MASKSAAKKEGQSAKPVVQPPPEVPLLANGVTSADTNAMQTALTELNIPFETTDAPMVLTAKVRSWLGEKLGEIGKTHTCTPECNLDSSGCPKLKCTRCGEVGTEDTSACPFCGSDGTDDAVEPVDTPATAVDSSEPEQAQDEPTSDDGPHEEESEAINDEEGEDSALQHGTEDAVVEPAQLEAEMTAINRLKHNIAGNYYDIGLHLRNIFSGNLWDPKVHKNFAAFAEKELGFSRALAYSVIDVVEKFTKEQFLEVGPSKLRLLASIEDDSQRQAALERAQAGATVRELEHEVRGRSSSGTAPTPESRTRRSSAPPKEPEAPPAPPVKHGGGRDITLLTKVDGKAKTYPFHSGSTGREVKAYNDNAFVEIQLSDGVVQRIAPKFDKGGILVGMTVIFQARQ